MQNSRGRYYMVYARLLYNALRFRYAKNRHSPLKPAVLSLAVTNRCNSHCIMCNIWKSAGNNPAIAGLELSGRKIISILSNPLFSGLVELDLTGGEPHLRNDLAEILRGIAYLKKNYLPNLRSIVVTSNGFLTQKVVSNYQNALNALKRTNIDLVSVTSLDGIGEIHDKIRGTADAYKTVSKTLRGLLELKKEYPNFLPGIKTTILPQNIGVLDSVLDFALSNQIFHIISPVLFTEARFRNMEKKGELVPGQTELNKIADFYNRQELKTSYFYATSHSFLSNGKKLWDCTAMYNYAFIDYDGQVYPCEIIPETIGNVKNRDFREIWSSPQADVWRKKIGKLDCCKTCHEPGAIRYSAFTGGWSYLKFLIKPGENRYTGSWHGEGYSKYLN